MTTRQFNRRDSLKSLAALGAAGTLGAFSELAFASPGPLRHGAPSPSPPHDPVPAVQRVTQCDRHGSGHGRGSDLGDYWTARPGPSERVIAVLRRFHAVFDDRFDHVCGAIDQEIQFFPFAGREI